MPSDWDPQVLPGWSWPAGPHLEISVYRPRLSDQESILESLHALLSLGAVLSGVGTTPAPGDDNVSPRNLNIHRSSELDAIVADPAQQIREFYTDGYFESVSIVSLSPISDQASPTDRRLVDVDFEATDFEIGTDDDKARIGEQAYRLLLELARSPEVAYGAIVGEGHWLSTPSVLADERSGAWFGSFLLTNWVDAVDRELVLDAFQAAYVEQLEFGTYVSTYEWLNPGRMRLLDGRQRDRSDLVRRVLAKNLA
ncbi:MAG TPA: hypothetical protein VMU72_10240 [Gaiellaceae bacterium]|nr:hypothetical protein [Gaiellaceae bacterium]